MKIFRCTRFVFLFFPVLYSDGDFINDVFWKGNLFNDDDFKTLHPFSRDLHNNEKPLGVILLDALIYMLYLPNFTIKMDDKSGWWLIPINILGSKLYRDLFKQNFTRESEKLTLPKKILSNRMEILNCIAVCLSKKLTGSNSKDHWLNYLTKPLDCYIPESLLQKGNMKQLGDPRLRFFVSNILCYDEYIYLFRTYLLTIF